MSYDKCYFCDNQIKGKYQLLSCDNHCFQKAHINCFKNYENYLIRLIGYPNYLNYEQCVNLTWNDNINLISDRIPCRCNSNCCFKPHVPNHESLFFYGLNFSYAHKELQKYKYKQYRHFY